MKAGWFGLSGRWEAYGLSDDLNSSGCWATDITRTRAGVRSNAAKQLNMATCCRGVRASAVELYLNGSARLATVKERTPGVAVCSKENRS
jgi:hypothetical protein